MGNDNAHLDIFSGIGGFAIAAREAGFKTVAFCESDSRCRAFLESTWGLPVEPDVRKLDGRKYAGISLLTGGPPCQPASRAGKQGGQGDDRWLWPEALRVLDEARPDCVVFENPSGILDVGIDGILSAMGRSGYEVQCFDIPACAVDSPQLRHRIWIVGFLADADERRKRNELRKSTSGQLAQRNTSASDIDKLADTPRDSERGIRETAGTDGERAGESGQPDSRDMAESQSNGCRETERRTPGITGHNSEPVAGLVADPECKRRKRRGAESREAESGWTCDSVAGCSAWENAIWVPCADGKLRRAPDDSFDLVDGLHRSLLGALGNSICPQVATKILYACRNLIS